MNKFNPTEHPVYKGFFLIPGYNRYAVSKSGDVITIVNSKSKKAGDSIKKSRNGHFVNVYDDQAGYRAGASVSKLLCLAFHGLPPSPVHSARVKPNTPINSETVEWVFNKAGNLATAMDSCKKGRVYYHCISTKVTKSAPTSAALAYYLNVHISFVSKCLCGVNKVIHGKFLVSRDPNEDWAELLKRKKDV